MRSQEEPGGARGSQEVPGKDSKSQWGGSPPPNTPWRSARRGRFAASPLGRWPMKGGLRMFEAVPGGQGESQDKGKEAKEGFQRPRGIPIALLRPCWASFPLSWLSPGPPGTAPNHLKMSYMKNQNGLVRINPIRLRIRHSKATTFPHHFAPTRAPRGPPNKPKSPE